MKCEKTASKHYFEPMTVRTGQYPEASAVGYQAQVAVPVIIPLKNLGLLCILRGGIATNDGIVESLSYAQESGRIISVVPIKNCS